MRLKQVRRSCGSSSLRRRPYDFFSNVAKNQLWTSQCAHIVKADPAENKTGQSILNLHPSINNIKQVHKLTLSKFEESKLLGSKNFWKANFKEKIQSNLSTNKDISYYLGILKSALMGCKSARGGSPSPNSIAVIPSDHASHLAS